MLILIVSIFSGCETFFEDYQNESFIMSNVDEKICSLLNSDSTMIARSSILYSDTTALTLADSISWLSTDSMAVITESNENAWSVCQPIGVSYLLIDIVSDGNYIIATNKSNDYLFKSNDGLVVIPSSDILDLETIAECSVIRSRSEYEMAQGTYFISFNRESEGFIKMAIINN